MAVQTPEETITDLEAQLTAYKLAETNILSGGQSFQKGGSDGFKAEMANLPAVQKKIQILENKIANMELNL